MKKKVYNTLCDSRYINYDSQFLDRISRTLLVEKSFVSKKKKKLGMLYNDNNVV